MTLLQDVFSFTQTIIPLLDESNERVTSAVTSRAKTGLRWTNSSIHSSERTRQQDGKTEMSEAERKGVVTTCNYLLTVPLVGALLKAN